MTKVLLNALAKADRGKFPDSLKSQVISNPLSFKFDLFPTSHVQAYSEEILGSMQRQLEITEARFPGWSQDPKIKQQVAIAKAKAAAFEIEKKNRIQAAANQAMASGGAIKSVISKSNTLPNLQNPVPAQKPMSDAMQVLILLRFNSWSTFL